MQRELPADAWEQILSCLPDHLDQVRCSAVSKEWNAVCRLLPELSIVVPPNVDDVERFIITALRGRSGLKKLKVDDAESESVLVRLKSCEAVSSTIEKLYITLSDDDFTEEAWSFLAEHFPKLETFEFSCGDMVVGPKGLKFTNLKKMFIVPAYMSAEALEQIIEACPSMEDLVVDDVDGPLVIESKSLQKLILHSSGGGTGKVVVRASNLNVFRFYRNSSFKVFEANKLKALYVNCPKIKVFPKELPNLESLVFISEVLDLHLAMNLMWRAKNLKHAKLLFRTEDEEPCELVLEQLIPPYLEVLTLNGNTLLGKLVFSDKEKHKFNLKWVAIDLRGGLNRPGENFGWMLREILLEIIYSSPQLEYLFLVVPHEMDCGGYYDEIEGMAFLHPRLHVFLEGDCCRCSTSTLDAILRCYFTMSNCTKPMFLN